MLWRIISFLLGAYVVFIVLNLLFSFAKMAVGFQVFSGIVAVGLIVFFISLMRRA